MVKKFAKYELPKSEEALDTLANSVLTYATPHIEETAGTGNSPSADWTDVPLDKWTAFKDALRHGHQPMQPAKGLISLRDAVAMGFSLLDDTRMSITVVNDAVDIDNISNGPIPGSHVHIIRYYIEGKAHRAKVPYHLAVFQVYLKGAGDAEPILNSERGWSKDYVLMNEPFEIRHEQSDMGKIAYYRAHWETMGGAKGPWSMMSAEVP
jgi:hypothetical protein